MSKQSDFYFIHWGYLKKSGYRNAALLKCMHDSLYVLFFTVGFFWEWALNLRYWKFLIKKTLQKIAGWLWSQLHTQCQPTSTRFSLKKEQKEFWPKKTPYTITSNLGNELWHLKTIRFFPHNPNQKMMEIQDNRSIQYFLTKLSKMIPSSIIISTAPLKLPFSILLF